MVVKCDQHAFVDRKKNKQTNQKNPDFCKSPTTRNINEVMSMRYMFEAQNSKDTQDLEIRKGKKVLD